MSALLEENFDLPSVHEDEPPTREYRIEVRVKEFNSPFKPSVTRHEFTVSACSEIQAFKAASGKVKTKGFPYDEVHVRNVGL